MTFISDSEADALSALLSRRSILGATAAAGGLLATPLSAFAQGTAAGGAGEAEITVDQARQAPIPIVIPSFGAGMGEQISSVISSDLAGTGLFKVMTGDVSPSGTPDFSALKAQGARAAVAGRAVGSGSVRVEMRLWNVVAGEQLQGTAYTASPSNWRRIAHIIADVIYERMLGEKGYFDTAMTVKKSVVGTGSATKEQVTMMVKRLLPGVAIYKADASDALAVAICHAHYRASAAYVTAGRRMA